MSPHSCLFLSSFFAIVKKVTATTWDDETHVLLYSGVIPGRRNKLVSRRAFTSGGGQHRARRLELMMASLMAHAVSASPSAAVASGQLANGPSRENETHHARTLSFVLAERDNSLVDRHDFQCHTKSRDVPSTADTPCRHPCPSARATCHPVFALHDGVEVRVFRTTRTNPPTYPTHSVSRRINNELFGAGKLARICHFGPVHPSRSPRAPFDTQHKMVVCDMPPVTRRSAYVRVWRDEV